MKYLKNIIANLPGIRLKKKYVIIHSDDWGSIRMPSNEVRKTMVSKYSEKIFSEYDRFDNLENSDDLHALYDVLRSVKDKNGNHAIFTPNCILGNPDFEKIEASNFESYYTEDVEDTFKSYGINDAFQIWKEGLKENIFAPQFHGLEHVNVPFWMEELQNDNPIVRDAFQNKTFSIKLDRSSAYSKNNFQAAWEYHSEKDEKYILESIRKGLQIFKDKFGFYSNSVIPPSYTWSERVEEFCRSNKVKQFQGIMSQKVPHTPKVIYKKRRNDTSYQMRNAFFEPSISKLYNAKDVLDRAKVILKLGKPLVIGTHRLNFIGSLDENNRKENLKEFKFLLNVLLKQHKDLEFISAQDYAQLFYPKNE